MTVYYPTIGKFHLRNFREIYNAEIFTIEIPLYLENTSWNFKYFWDFSNISMGKLLPKISKILYLES